MCGEYDDVYNLVWYGMVLLMISLFLFAFFFLLSPIRYYLRGKKPAAGGKTAYLPTYLSVLTGYLA